MANYSSIPQHAAGGSNPLPTVGYAPGYPQGQAQAPGYPQGQGQAPGYPQGQGYPAGAAGSLAPAGATSKEEQSGPPPQFDQIAGYGKMGFEGTVLPPPSYEDATREPPEREDIPSAAFLTIEDAKEALASFVAEDCCYGKGPLDEIQYSDIRSSNAFHYSLESFCESRTSKWKDEPFHGQPVVVTGLPPGPWDIQAQPPQMFQDSEMKVEVPNTASVKPCQHCYATGFKRCTHCNGSGRDNCSFCHGSGRRLDDRCNSCGGLGNTSCNWCHGNGQTKCQKCNGHANLRWHVQLKIKWKNHDDHHVVERMTLPPQLIKNVSGQKALEESFPRVWPINHFPEQEINNASKTLIDTHARKFPSERMLMQRQKVRVIPVTEVFYKYKQTESSFFVYGMERKIHFPAYPSQCCGCCSIL